MKILEQVDLNRIPDTGYMLAYFRLELVFMESGIKEELQKRELEDLLELHIFDENKEYRLIRMQDGTWIETLVSDDVEQKDKKVECVKVEEKYAHIMKYLNVINYIDYDENGMISIQNYRLSPAKDEKCDALKSFCINEN